MRQRRCLIDAVSLPPLPNCASRALLKMRSSSSSKTKPKKTQERRLELDDRIKAENQQVGWPTAGKTKKRIRFSKAQRFHSLARIRQIAGWRSGAKTVRRTSFSDDSLLQKNIFARGRGDAADEMRVRAHGTFVFENTGSEARGTAVRYVFSFSVLIFLLFLCFCRYSGRELFAPPPHTAPGRGE